MRYFKCNIWSSHCWRMLNKGVVCFKCQNLGHMAKNFHELAKPKLIVNVVKATKPTIVGRVFAMNGAKAPWGTSYIYSDSRATHSFISYNYANRLSLPTCLLSFDILVSTSTTSLAVTSSMCLNYHIVVNGRIY
ncbi:hypothetical protein CR513_36553, partial [Mucuna pruriens]